MSRDTSDKRYRDLLDDRRDLLRIQYNSDNPRELDEIEQTRLRAISFELDILDYDSPHGQWLDAQIRAFKKFDAAIAVDGITLKALESAVVELRTDLAPRRNDVK